MKIKEFFCKCKKHITWFKNSLSGYIEFRKIIDENSCVLFSHNGDSAGGAPVVLLELACSIKDDEKVVFLCGKPGSILDLCKENHIQAFSTYLLQHAFVYTMKRKRIKALVVNTIALAKTITIINNVNCSFPIFWWIHEEKKLISRYRNCIPMTLKPNIRILCVSSTVQLNLNEIVPEYCGRSEVFYYGCRDIYSDYNAHLYANKDEKTFIVSVIGRICVRKNQIQVIQAYNRLPDKIKKRMYIQFIYASSEQEYLQQLKEMSMNEPNIKFIGSVSRNKMDKIYYASNLIVCSSIDDPLPVVITEAMMLKIPFITSSKTGQYYLVQNEINGYKYNVNSVEELMGVIISVFNNENLERLREEERKLYLDYFTLNAVKDKFELMLSNSRTTI